MLEASNLPLPSAAAREVSDRLADQIRRSIIEQAGPISFDEYMRIALYEPGLGYYLANAINFGVDGDFITAPELSSLFGASVARQCFDILQHTGGDILEFGAGNGFLAAHVLTTLDELGAVPGRYMILELNPLMRERQRQTLQEVAPHVLSQVEWLNDLPSCKMNGVILANEIIDALPVKIFRTANGEIHERRVAEKGDHFIWSETPAPERLAGAVRARVDSNIIAADRDYVSEINSSVEPWVSDLSRVMGNAVALIFDYGYSRADYYSRDRTQGTLMCHFRHRQHNDPFWFPGLQDITASVDFTALAEAADSSGIRVAGFSEQGNFLLASGLLDEAQRRAEKGDDRTLARVAYETKVLTLPNEMGSRFKVLALTKGYNAALRGFQLRDDRHRL
ncbi:MAG: SAM-dependent MidA family methyltransferase [Gammaproteobacteria bacterium]|jgi:SAM-dependent MidA family methyltransferase